MERPKLLAIDWGPSFASAVRDAALAAGLDYRMAGDPNDFMDLCEVYEPDIVAFELFNGGGRRDRADQVARRS